MIAFLQSVSSAAAAAWRRLFNHFQSSLKNDIFEQIWNRTSPSPAQTSLKEHVINTTLGSDLSHTPHSSLTLSPLSPSFHLSTPLLLITAAYSAFITPRSWSSAFSEIYKLLSLVEVNWGAERDQWAVSSTVTPQRQGQSEHARALALSAAVNTYHGADIACFYTKVWGRLSDAERPTVRGKRRDGFYLQQQTHSLQAHQYFTLNSILNVCFLPKASW